MVNSRLGQRALPLPLRPVSGGQARPARTRASTQPRKAFSGDFSGVRPDEAHHARQSASSA